MTSKHESTTKNTHDNTIIPTSKQTITRLTQIGHQGNLTWNCAHQTIAGERQVSCRMKNDKQALEYNGKTHNNTIITTSKQTTAT
jgi:hypothetical protein